MSGKSQLLKDAIADAKAITDTALANARMRMEEAFTPRLQSMISARLQNEIEGEDEDETIDLDEPTDEVPTEEVPTEEVPTEEGPTEEVPVEPEVPAEEVPVEPEVPAEEVPVEPEVPAEEVPVEPEVPAEDSVEVEPDEDLEEEGIDSLDLSSILRELDDEANLDDTIEEPVIGDEDEITDENTEIQTEEKLIAPLKNDKNVTPTLTGEKGPNAGGGEQVSPDRGKPFSSEKGAEHAVSPDLKQNSKNAIYEEEEESEEEIDLTEILNSLQEDSVMSDDIPEQSNPFKSANVQLTEKVKTLSKQLTEHRNVIRFLKAKLNELNLLNAKLLFTSKLFKQHNMSNGQKMKVIESFDRAKTFREVKLVYTTIAESFGSVSNLISSKPAKKVVKKISEAINSGASKVVASTKPNKIITESIEPIVDSESANRLRKLAKIKTKK